jgi:hypothetical protein
MNSTAKLGVLCLLAVVCAGGWARAQDGARAISPGAISVVGNPSDTGLAPLQTTREKWDNFAKETVGPLTWGGGAFNALFSQVTNTDPKCGVDREALGERFGASLQTSPAEFLWRFRGGVGVA